MKNIFILICILFLAFLSVSSAFAQDSTFIKITLSNSEKWSTDSVKIYNFLYDKWTYFDKIDTATNSCFLKFPCERAIEQNVYLGNNKGFYLLTLSKDTIEIGIDEEGKPIFLKGKTYRENQITYNMYSYPKFDIDFWFNNSPSPIDIHDLDIFFRRNDSTLRSMIESCDTSLKQIDVDSTFDKYFRNQLAVHKYQMKEDEDKSIFKNKIDENYPYAKDYIDLLYEQILEANCVKTERGYADYKYYSCAYQQVKKIEDEQIRNYLILKILDDNSFANGMLYKTKWWSEEEKLFNELMHQVKKTFPNNKQVAIIEEKAALYKQFARGAPAPDFTLKDLIGKEVSLSDFKGKYVFFTFIDSAAQNLEVNSWYSNLLYKEYTDEKIAFLYIFVNGTEESWKNLISTQEVEGIHLFANKEQSKELYENYGDKIHKIKSSDFQMKREGLDTRNYNVAFINKKGYFISRLLYLGHNMDWVAKKILNGE
ncbi:redoxin domain-containing protein [Bernardetia sp. Wsw4-3y2]|uniref:peroxiredoxin family protein n=1 Tax=Bernardetia sp. Wsw4-3y2 TaxID=3127471 RepID=UPI0030D34F23